MDKVFLSWLAAFWEGEGCIAYFKNGNFRVEITQTIEKNKTTENTMKLIQRHFKGRIRIYKSKIKHYLPAVKWTLNNHTDMLYFLNKICPYCQLRKQFVLDSIEKINNRQYKHYRNYNPYLNKIVLYLKRKYTYKTISMKLKKFISISPATLCRIIKDNSLTHYLEDNKIDDNIKQILLEEIK